MKRIHKLSLCCALVLIAFVACLTATVAYADETETITKQFSVSLDDLKPSQFSMASANGVYYNSYRDGLNDNQKILYDNLKSFFLNSNGLAKEYTTDTLAISTTQVGIDYSISYDEDYSAAADTLWDEIKPDYSYAFFSFIFDYPQAFWTNKVNINASFSVNTTSHVVWVKQCKFTFTLISSDYSSLISTYNSNITAAAAKIASNSTTTYDLVKGINDYLCETCTYNTYAAVLGGDAYRYAHSSGEVFASSTHSIVCDGYAKSYKALANILGVDCAIIVGYGNGGTHAWNDVRLGNYWYPVDSTWNDSTNSDKYLLQAASSFLSTHTEVEDQISTSGNISFTFPTLNTKTYKEQCLADGHKYVMASDGSYVCDYCNEKKTITHTHTASSAVKENIIDPTCTTDGSYDSVVYCSSCKEEISRETVSVSKLGHSYKLTQAAVSATCTKDGRTEISICSDCGDIIGGKAIPATGHTVGEAVKENIVEATCENDGSYDSVVYCTECGEEISRETVTTPKFGHNYVVTGEAVEPTETACGRTEEKTCTICGDVIGGEIIPIKNGGLNDLIVVHNHTDGEPVIENKIDATCTTDGSYDLVVYCTECGEEISRTTVKISKLGHSYKVTSSAKSATCTADGHTEEKTCTVCGDKIGREVIKATGHKPGTAVKENVVRATCTKDGSYDSVVYCTECGEEISRTTVKISKLGHSYKVTSSAKSATCTADGHTEEKTCSVCGDKIGGEVIKATGHKSGTAVKENVVSATCSKEGSYDSVVYCTVCKKEISRTTVKISKLSHTYKTTVVSPTYKAGGYTIHKCTVCGAYYLTDKTAMLKLSAPSVSVSNKAGGIQITWNKVSGATKYILYRGSTGIKTFSSTATLSYLDTSVKSKDGYGYIYKVVACVADSSKQYQTASTSKVIYRLVSPTISKAKNSASKAITVTWKKQSGATGYQVQYSRATSFSSATTLYITKNTTLSKKITGLVKGKYYCIRVRTYKTVNGVKYYSAWTTYSGKVKVSK